LSAKGHFQRTGLSSANAVAWVAAEVDDWIQLKINAAAV
jgi:predicted DNA-binding transcriptional regulator AlpA